MWKPGQIVTINHTIYRVKKGSCFKCEYTRLSVVDEPCFTCLSKKLLQSYKTFNLSRICGK